MSANNDPEPLLCVQCGRPLAETTAPCSFCEGADAEPDPPGAMEAFRLRRRARAQLLWGIDAWPIALLAAYTARRGLRVEEGSIAPDARMVHGLRRLYLLALVFAGLGVASLLVRWAFF